MGPSGRNHSKKKFVKLATDSPKGDIIHFYGRWDSKVTKCLHLITRSLNFLKLLFIELISSKSMLYYMITSMQKTFEASSLTIGWEC